jgi:hypothetical protein
MTHGMRKIAIIILFIIMTIPTVAQRSADYGISAGITTYLGEINPANLFHKPGPAVSLFYRYNFNPRQAIRANLLGGYLSARDQNLKYTSDQALHSFSGILGELGVTYEYNFFPYSTFRSRYVDYTPYIAAGAAVSFVYNHNATEHLPFPSIPFSAGFKVNVANHIGIEFEYGFRKTFYDKFDGLYELTDPVTHEPVDHSWIHNNDWYSFMGVSITWKMYNQLVGCPAFADLKENKKRKR